MSPSARLAAVAGLAVSAAALVALVLLLSGGGGEESLLDPESAPADRPGAPAGDASGLVPSGRSVPEGAAPGGIAPAAAPGPAGGSGAAAAEGDSEAVPLLPGRLAGRVLDARTRQPVAGASAAVSAEGAPAREAVSGADGGFRVDGCPAGAPLVLRVSKAGYEPLERPGIALAEGAGLRLEPVLLAPLPLVRGSVTDDKGGPAAGAVVRLTGELGMKFGPDMDFTEVFKKIALPEETLAETRTSADGSFAFWPGEIGEGEVCLRAGAPGLATTVVHGVAAKPGSAALSVALQKAGVLAGTVKDALRGTGVEGAFLAVVSEPDERDMMEGRLLFDKYWTESGEGGKFRLEDVPPGDYALVTRREGFATEMRDRVRVPDEAVAVELRAAFVLLGKVIDDATGKPVAGAKVTAIPQEEGSGFGSAVTDAEGSYRCAELSPGTYMLIVAAQGYSGFSEPLEAASGADLRRDVRLKGGIRVSGRVLDAETRKPLPGVRILSVDRESDFFPGRSHRPRGESGPDGAFVLQGVPVGTETQWGEDGERPAARRTVVALVAAKEGWYQDDPAVFDAAPGVDLENAEVLLRPGCRAAGRLTDPDGKPVAGAKVAFLGQDDAGLELLLAGGDAPKPCATDAEGKFLLVFPPSKEGRVWIHHPDFAFELAELPALPPGKEAPLLEVRLARGGSVEGLVFDEKGQPAGGVRVDARFRAEEADDWNLEEFPQTRPAAPSTTTAPDGSFRFAHLKAGAWSLQPSVGKERAAGAQEVRVEEGRATRARLALSPRLSISGIVVDPAGAPVAGVWISAHEPGSRQHASTRTGRDGTFRLDGLLEGAYTLGAWDGEGSVTTLDAQAGSTGMRIVLKKRAKGSAPADEGE